MTVTGTTSPSSPKSWLIPSLIPISPPTMVMSRFPPAAVLLVLGPESLDLDVDRRRQVELHQRVDGLRRRIEDVDQALVRPDLELLARLLVDVRRAQDAELVLYRRERNRPRDPRPGALGDLDDLRRGLVQHPVVVGLQPDSDLFVLHV